MFNSRMVGGTLSCEPKVESKHTYLNLAFNCIDHAGINNDG